MYASSPSSFWSRSASSLTSSLVSSYLVEQKRALTFLHMAIQVCSLLQSTRDLGKPDQLDSRAPRRPRSCFHALHAAPQAGTASQPQKN